MGYKMKISEITVQLLLLILSVIMGYFLIKEGVVTSIKTLVFVTAFYFGIILLILIKKSSAGHFVLERIVVFMMIGSAFLQSAFFSFNFGAFSLFPFRIFFLLLVFLLFVNYLINKGLFSEKNIEVKGYLAFFFFWLLYALLSLVWAKSIVEGIKYLVLLGIGISVVFLVIFLLKKFSNYVTMFYIWLFMLCIVTVIGVWNHVTQHHLSTSAMINAPEHKLSVPTSVFYNPNDFASYLAVSVFFVTAFIIYGKKFIVRLGATGLLLVMLYLIYVTESRGSLLAIPIGVAGIFFLSLPTKYKKASIVVISSIFALVLIIRFDVFYSYYDKAISFIHTEDAVNSNTIRKNLILNSVQFLVDSNGFGVGSGNAEYYMENQSTYPTRNVYNVHNWWVELLVNFGAVVFIGYILLYVGIIYQIYCIYKKSVTYQQKMISHALLGGVITFIVASISPSSLSNLNFHWVLLAFALGYINWYRTKGQKESLVK